MSVATLEANVNTHEPWPAKAHMGESSPDITLLLKAAGSGERRDLDALLMAIYDDLRRLASSHLQRERAGHTLQSTALVHEAYVKLIDQRTTDWKDRLHFFAIASRIIRRILIDHARARESEKRGGGRTRLSVDDHDLVAAGGASEVDLLALDEALKELHEIDEQQARIVELRYFGGCTVEEVAELLGIGKRTVDRDWQAAKAWLMVRLGDDEGGV
jgi:RNA polymerase sigma-70 factor, ECF subfamily